MSTLDFYPFAYALRNEQLDNYCWYCLKEKEHGATMQRCSACKTALFCGQQCQRLGWMDHKAECHGLQESRPYIPTCDGRLLGRTVLRHMQITNGEHLKTKDFFLNRNSRRSLMDLCDHAEEMRRDKAEMLEFKKIYVILICSYKEKYLLPKDEILKIYSIICTNGVSIGSKNPHVSAIAKALYLDLSAYNHSCRPNAAFKNDGLVATLYPVAEGVDLADTDNTFITYIELLLSKKQRQKKLKDLYYFDCKCIRCLDENDHLLTAVRCPKCSHSVTIYDSNDKLKKDPLVCGNCGHKLTYSVDAAIKDMERIDRMLDDPATGMLDLSVIAEVEKKLGKENIYLARLYEVGLELVGMWQFAQRLDYLLKSLPCLLRCYPKNYPQLAYHYMNIAMHQQGCNDNKPAVENLNEAMRKLTLSVGTEDVMYKKCISVRDLTMKEK